MNLNVTFLTGFEDFDFIRARIFSQFGYACFFLTNKLHSSTLKHQTDCVERINNPSFGYRTNLNDHLPFGPNLQKINFPFGCLASLSYCFDDNLR